MIVWPGLRRSVSAISRLFNSASFYAPLTHSAVPVRAATGTTATFTRATPKTVENNDGHLVTLLAGEIGFPGARRVRNLVSSSDISTWSTTSGVAIGSGVTDPDGGTTAYTLTCTAPSGYWVDALASKLSIGVCVNSCYVRRRTGTGVVRIYNGATGSGTEDITAQITTEWTRIIAAATAVTALAANFIGFDFQIAGDAIDVWHPQCEDVTAQTTQTAGEYVSVGVPSDWAGDELVTNGTFDTDTTGWTTSSATQAVVSGRLRITNTAAAYGSSAYAIATVVGSKYVVSLEGWGGTAGQLVAQAINASGGALLGTTGAVATTGNFTFEFTAAQTGTNIIIYGDDVNGSYHDVDNISVKPAYYHGSFVDGVKCFATDLAGNALTTMLGYNAEGARTNVITYSQAFDNADWVKQAGGAGSAPVVTANSTTAPDGTTTAAKVVFAAPGSGDTSLLVSKAFTPTGSVSYTGAVYVKAFAAGDVGKQLILRHVGAAGYTELTLASDWQRLGSTETSFAVPLNLELGLRPVAGGGSSGTVSCYLWGAQVELGSFASSYISTGAASASRAADVLTYSSAGNIDGTKGWVYAECVIPNEVPGTQKTILETNGGIGDPLYVANSGEVSLYDGAAERKGVAITSSAAVKKLASTWGGASCLTAADGTVSAALGFDGDLGNTGPISVGQYLNGLAPIDGNIGPIYIGQRQLSASELQAITAA